MKHLKTGSVLFLLLCAGAIRAEAQGVASTFDQLAVLVQPGDKVTVVDVTGRETKGRIWKLSQDALILGTSAGPRQLGEVDVSMISQRRDDSLKNGAIIGAVAATAFFVTVGDAPSNDSDGGDVIVSSAIGGRCVVRGDGRSSRLGNRCADYPPRGDLQKGPLVRAALTFHHCSAMDVEGPQSP